MKTDFELIEEKLGEPSNHKFFTKTYGDKTGVTAACKFLNVDPNFTFESDCVVGAFIFAEDTNDSIDPVYINLSVIKGEDENYYTFNQEDEGVYLHLVDKSDIVFKEGK